ncbi:N-acetylneuraminate lyase [Lederbergia graminis]|uniref:N-acetylneuraminate lyase n=1 Tax=Lederbergia graminis TaxID=735518 RepID=A0ABW0LK49_9BACI
MSAQIERYKGIIPALITPYTNEGKINEAVTRKLIQHLLSKGVKGLYLSGSTGEGFLQTVEERKQFLEIVVDEVQGEVPVISQVGAVDTNTCVELTKHAAEVGADAVSAVAPFYYKHGSEQIKQHYLDIVNAADIPLIIYHIPDFTGTSGSIDFYEELSKVENIIGLKYTSKDTFFMQQLIDVCGDEFMVFNGPDECCIAGLAVGAHGAIGSTYNIMPEKFVSLFNHFANGNIAAAKQEQYEANRLIRKLLDYDFIAFEREVLTLQGFDVGKPRKPLQQLTDMERSQIRKIVEEFPFLQV